MNTKGMIAHSTHYLSQSIPLSQTVNTMHKKNVPMERHLSHDLLGTNSKVQKSTKKMIQESHLMSSHNQRYSPLEFRNRNGDGLGLAVTDADIDRSHSCFRGCSFGVSM